MSKLSKSPERILAFDAVMTEGSLSGAARALKLSQPTVRRAIEALEVELGTPLFTRSDNGILPTERATAVWPLARDFVELMHAFRRTVQAGSVEVAGPVRLTASRVVASYVLPPILAKLTQAHPGLRVEVVPDDRTRNLLRRDADIAIRHTPPQQVQLVAKKVKTLELGLFCHPSLTEMHRVPTTVAECLDLLPIIWEDRDTFLTDAAVALGLPRPTCVSVATDDQALQIACIASGAGAGICQVRVAQRLGLTRLALDWSHPLPAWLVTHEDQLSSHHIRRTFDHLASAFD